MATACIGHDDMRAVALFSAISAENDVREAWLGLATARRRLGDAIGAAAALAAGLRRHVPDPGFAALADRSPARPALRDGADCQGMAR